MFCGSLFVVLSFSFGHCIVCPISIYGVLLPLWYLKSFHTEVLIPYSEWVSDCCLSPYEECCKLYQWREYGKGARVMVFNTTFTHLFQLYLAVSFIGGGNRSIASH
jgi:hypothetical protein